MSEEPELSDFKEIEEPETSSVEEIGKEEEEKFEEKVLEKAETETRLKKRGLRKKIKYIENKREDYDGERFLTVRFYPRLLSVAKWKRASRSVKILREKITKYIKNVEDPISGRKIRIKNPTIWISPEMNALLWSRGAKNPPRKVRVRVLYKIIDADEGEVELRVFPFFLKKF